MIIIFFKISPKFKKKKSIFHAQKQNNENKLNKRGVSSTTTYAWKLHDNQINSKKSIASFYMWKPFLVGFGIQVFLRFESSIKKSNDDFVDNESLYT